VILNDVLELIQLLLGVLLSEVLIFEISLSLSVLNGTVTFINGLLAAIIDKGRVVTKFGALSISGPTLLGRVPT
jgi:hypothetical protein